MNISASDKFGNGGFGGLDMPKLKGHVKIRVWNPKTHKTEFTHEGDNIVTNGIPEIMARNILGSLNYGSMLPLCDKWFGGVLAFRNAFSTVTIDGNVVPDPSKYYPEGDDVNPVIAHAGDTAPATASIVAQDLKRGSPTSVVKTGNSIKFDWQWLPSQGNGIINAVSLTHVDTGNAGIGSTSDAFKAFAPWANLSGSDLGTAVASFDSIQTVFAQYDDNHGLYFHIGEDADWYSSHSSFATKKLTIKIRRLPFNKIGLHDIKTVISLGERSFTVTLTENLYIQPSYYFDYANKRLWVFNNATKKAPAYSDYDFTWTKNSVNYAVIDCESETVVDEGTITSDANDLAPTCMQSWENAGSYTSTTSKWENTNIIIDGDYIYLPMSDGVTTGGRDSLFAFNVKGYKKINMTDSSDQTELLYNETLSVLQPMAKYGGLLVNNGRLVNNAVGYTCASQIPFGGFGSNSYTAYALTSPDKITTLANAVGTGNGSTTNASRYIYAPKLLLSTKYNLPAQVEKTGVQAMTIEYTLTEQ